MDLDGILTLTNMVAERRKLLKAVKKAPRSKVKRLDKSVDELADQIRKFVLENRDMMSFENIVETLTSLGEAPSVLYDDNGHFAVCMDGSQNLPTIEKGFERKKTTFNGVWWLPAGAWKRTIREALYFYLDRRD